MKSKLTRLAVCVLPLLSLAACSWNRRKPLAAHEVSAPLAAHGESLIVYVEPSLDGRPLPETIWDNTVGPAWNVQESKQIGFTQNYGAAPILLPRTAAVVTSVNTRLVLPFGRSFSGVLESALDKSYPKHVTCFDAPCLSDAVSRDASSAVLRVKIDWFYAWEGPLNHLNFAVKATSKLDRRSDRGDVEHVHEKDALEKSVGGFFTTHMAMIDKMNDLLGAFSEDLAVDIVTTGFSG